MLPAADEASEACDPLGSALAVASEGPGRWAAAVDLAVGRLFLSAVLISSLIMTGFCRRGGLRTGERLDGRPEAVSGAASKAMRLAGLVWLVAPGLNGRAADRLRRELR